MATPYRLLAYRDTITLWSDAESKAPRKPRIHINLADAFNKAGNADAAVRELVMARALLPDAPLAIDRKQSWLFLVNVELGLFAHTSGQSELARTFFGDAVKASPESVTWIAPPAP